MTDIFMMQQIMKRIIDTNDSSIEKVLCQSYFFQLWNAENDFLISYVIEHFDEVIEATFLLNEKYSLRFSKRCNQILVRYSSQKILSRLAKETNLIDWMINIMFKIDQHSYKTQKNFFVALYKFLSIDEIRFNEKLINSGFYEEMIKNLKNYLIELIIKNIFIEKNHFMVRMLQRINVNKLLVNNLLSDNDVLINASASILSTELNNKCYGNLPNCLVKDSKIDKLIKKAIDDKQVALMEFVQTIFEFSSSFLYSLQWKDVSKKIVSYQDNILDCINSSEKFTKICYVCTNIVCLIYMKNKIISNKFNVLIIKMNESFFKFPTNSVLHNSFLNLIRVVSSNKKFIIQFLHETKLHNRIIECYENRDSIETSCYWGQLREISYIINKYVSKIQGVDNKKWNEIVMKTNLHKEEIISKSYGGSNHIFIRARAAYKNNFFLHIFLILIILMLSVLVYRNYDYSSNGFVGIFDKIRFNNTLNK